MGLVWSGQETASGWVVLQAQTAQWTRDVKYTGLLVARGRGRQSTETECHCRRVSLSEDIRSVRVGQQ